MTDYVYCIASYQNANLFEIRGLKAEVIGTVKTEAQAHRICVLLTRHGMQDCTTSDLEDALTDLEQRNPNP